MKNKLLYLALISTLNGYTKDIIWKQTNPKEIFKVTQEQLSFSINPKTGKRVAHLDCFDDEKLIIDGQVEIVHPDENIMNEKPEIIQFRCKDVHFNAGSKLYTNSDLFFFVLNELSGNVQIESTRGRRGFDGADNLTITPAAANGVSGGNGSKGSDAECFINARPPESGSTGGHGSNGATGAPGKEGYAGSNGTKAAKIIVEAVAIRPDATFNLITVGGEGGNGGRGSNGSKGGDGGVGGSGGKGGNGICAGYWTYRGGNGGQGGNGGHGGNGGNGGPGGKGGNGGDGGDIRLWVIEPTRFTQNFYVKIDADTSGGKKGIGGLGGIGGEYGKGALGGSGGAGGGALEPLVSEGKRGANGKKGEDGIQGSDGPKGADGQDGKDGDRQIFNLARVERRDNPNFYDLPRRDDGNKKSQKVQKRNFVKEIEETLENEQNLEQLFF